MATRLTKTWCCIVLTIVGSGASFGAVQQTLSQERLFDELSRELSQADEEEDKIRLIEQIATLDVPFQKKLDTLVLAMEREYELMQEFDHGPNPTPYSVATDVLGRAGEESLDALEGCLREASNDLVRYVCMCAMSDVGSRPSFAVQLEQYVRRSAYWDSKGIFGIGDCAGKALSSIGKQSVPHLMSLLRDRNSLVATIAIKELARLGRDAGAAVPALVEKMRDSKRYERLMVIEALGAIGPGARDALPALQELLESERDRTASTVAERMREKTVTALEEAISRIKGVVPKNSVRSLEGNVWVKVLVA